MIEGIKISKLETIMKATTIRAAAIQLEPRFGDTRHNLNACLELAEEAVNQGAAWIALPEFFNTGAIFDPQMVDVIENEQGVSAKFLQEFSAKHDVVIGGSFICRLQKPDGSPAGVRNRYLCFSNGELIGRHDKDLPTMWEAALYEEGDVNDTGELGSIEGVRVGTAVCWEFLRTQTARRLQGKIDVLIGGSHWWSIPENWPKLLTRKLEKYNSDNFIKTVQETARLIGAPVIHASHCGKIESQFPSIPFMNYKGKLEGHTAIINAEGEILAHRSKEQGQGIVIADITPGYSGSNQKIPDTFWLRSRGVLPTISWTMDGFFGKRWYKKNVLNK